MARLTTGLRVDPIPPTLEQAALDMIGRIYDAVIDPNLWPAVLEGLGHWCDPEIDKRPAAPPRFAATTRQLEHSLSLLMQLQPHLRRAADLQQRCVAVDHERQLLQLVLEQTTTAVMIADQLGTVNFANEAAQTLLRQSDGLTCLRHRLHADDPGSRQELASAIWAACNDGRTSIVGVGQRRSEDRLVLFVAPGPPVPSVLVDSTANALIYATAPADLSATSAPALQSLLDLTPAEARLAAALAAGAGLEDLANEWSVSVNTLRSRLQSIFTKTGTDRQAGLVLVIFRHLFGFDLQRERLR